MPGLFGIIGGDNIENGIRDLDSMVSCMKHEKFYSFGKFIDIESGIFVGWTAHKGLFGDTLPIYNKDRTVLLLFSGEDFAEGKNYNDISIQNLGKMGENLAEYLIEKYEKYHDNYFEKLNGFFHGAIIDLKNKSIKIFNDRFGMKRLYYYYNEREFIFSSEAKSILKIRPELKVIDQQSLGEYFSHGCVLENRTLFKKIFLVPGSSVFSIGKDKKLTKNSYFSPKQWEEQTILTEDEFANNLIDKFKQVIPKYLSSPQEIALSLTGGIDTRILLSAVNLSPNSLPCYTYGGMYRKSYDVIVSEKVAAMCGQNHQVLTLGEDFLHNFRDFADKTIYLSDGCVDITGAPNLYMSKNARKIAPIRLTGNYGQEVLRRYIAFKPNPPEPSLFNEDFLRYIRSAKDIYHDSIKNMHPLTFALFKQAPWYQYGRYSLEATQFVQRSPFMDNDIVRLVYCAPSSVFNGEDFSKMIIYRLNSSLSSILTDLGKLGNLPWSISFLIKFWRYMLFKMEWYYNHRLPRKVEMIDYFLRSFHFERLFIGRNKYYHMKIWFRDQLSEYIKEILLSPISLQRMHINNKRIPQIINEHTKGIKSHTDEICALISAELIFRTLID